MEIREVNKDDDINEICNVYLQSWKVAYKGIIPQHYLDHICKEQWYRSLQNDSRKSIVMLENNKIIGTSSYSFSRDEDRKEYGEIISIYILPEYCHKGYGKYLLNASINGLRNMGFSHVFLWVLEGNDIARAFYQKNGFTYDNTIKQCLFAGTILNELRYVKHM